MKKLPMYLLALTFLIFSVTGCSGKSEHSPDNPVTLTMWHVYGNQTESPLNDLIDEFNRTDGRKSGITVSVVSVTDSSAIDDALTASANNEPGTAPLPDLFTAYPRIVEKIGTERLLDWSDYFSEEELLSFVDSFLSEGYFGSELLMLPIAKSTELLFLNRTFFDRFCADTGINTEALSDFEALFSACEQYYDWSGGKDMFQINDFYHYFLVNIRALGGEFIRNGSPDCDSKQFRTVYTPMAHAAVCGGICVGDGYASDRWKTGEIISNIGSTAGILYLREDVTYPDNTTEKIKIELYPYPQFSGSTPTVLKRGSGLFAVKSENEQKNKAAAEFAKWITKEQNNLDFVTKAGYLPVTDSAFSHLTDQVTSISDEKYRALYRTVQDMYGQYTFCTLPLYGHSADVQPAFESAVKAVLSDARAEYILRTSAGENKDAVAAELTASSLAQIKAAIR